MISDTVRGKPRPDSPSCSTLPLYASCCPRKCRNAVRDIQTLVDGNDSLSVESSPNTRIGPCAYTHIDIYYREIFQKLGEEHIIPADGRKRGDIYLECLIPVCRLGTLRMQCGRDHRFVQRVEELEKSIGKTERKLWLLLRGAKVKLFARI